MGQGVLCPSCNTVADVEARECPKCGTPLVLSMDRTQIRRTDSIVPPAPRLTVGPLQTLDEEASAQPTSQLVQMGPRPVQQDAAQTLLGEPGEWDSELDTNPRERRPGLSDRTVSVPFPTSDSGPVTATLPPTQEQPIQPPPPVSAPAAPERKKGMTGQSAVPASMRRTVTASTLEKALPRPPVSAPRPQAKTVMESTEPASRIDALTGLKLGEWEVKERVGIGGMSTVYRAPHQKIGRDGAVKVLRTDVVADARDMEQLLHEARSIGDIHHPGIIQIFDAGEIPDGSGRQYLVMEFLDGESLEQRLERDGRLPLRDAIPIIDDTLSALAAAHQAGVVHRDIKPANVFLVRQPDGRPWVKLVDFGLARPSTRREVSRVAGTPDYISPEHARGKPAAPAADIYSLGVLAFVLVTGKLPFTGATAHEVMEKHVKVPPPSPLSIDPGVPPQLNALILRMLEKDPVRRPDAAQIRAELKAVLRQVSTSTSDRDALAITRDSGRVFAQDEKSDAESSPDMLATLQGHRTAPMPIVVPQSVGPAQPSSGKPRTFKSGSQSAGTSSVATTLPSERKPSRLNIKLLGWGLLAFAVVLLLAFLIFALTRSPAHVVPAGLPEAPRLQPQKSAGTPSVAAAPAGAAPPAAAAEAVPAAPQVPHERPGSK